MTRRMQASGIRQIEPIDWFQKIEQLEDKGVFRSGYRGGSNEPVFLEDGEMCSALASKGALAGCGALAYPKMMPRWQVLSLRYYLPSLHISVAYSKIRPPRTSTLRPLAGQARPSKVPRTASYVAFPTAALQAILGAFLVPGSWRFYRRLDTVMVETFSQPRPPVGLAVPREMASGIPATGLERCQGVGNKCYCPCCAWGITRMIVAQLQAGATVQTGYWS